MQNTPPVRQELQSLGGKSYKEVYISSTVINTESPSTLPTD